MKELVVSLRKSRAPSKPIEQILYSLGCKRRISDGHLQYCTVQYSTMETCIDEGNAGCWWIELQRDARDGWNRGTVDSGGVNSGVRAPMRVAGSRIMRISYAT